MKPNIVHMFTHIFRTDDNPLNVPLLMVVISFSNNHLRKKGISFTVTQAELFKLNIFRRGRGMGGGVVYQLTLKKIIIPNTDVFECL